MEQVMLRKDFLISEFQSIPNQIGVDDVIEKILLMSKIQKGINDIDNNNTKTHQEVEVYLNKWLK
jgi:hypothetical protein